MSSYKDIETMEQLNAAIKEVSRKSTSSRETVGRHYLAIKQNLTPLSMVSGLVKKGVNSFNWVDLGLTAARFLTRRVRRK